MGAVISQPASRGKPARTGRGPSPAQAQAVNGQPPAGNRQPSSQASRIGSGTRGNVPVLYEPLLCGACKASLVFVHDVVTDTTRTRVEPAFEPGLVRQLKSAAEHDMRVGARTWPDRPSRPGWPTRCGYSWFLLSSEVASERSRRRPLRSEATGYAAVRQRCCLPQVLPPVSLSDGADLGDPGLEHPARAGRRDVPTGLARGSGLGNSHRSSAGARAAGPVRQEADPGLSQGAGVCLRPSRAVRAIPVARSSQPGP